MLEEDFEFLNSKTWLKYTQERYVPVDDIKYRLEKLGIHSSEWEELKVKILKLRKLNSVPLFINTLDKKFWYFPSDSIQKKISRIEHLGNKAYERIQSKTVFKNKFLANARIEEAITSAIYEGANSTRAKAKQFIADDKEPQNKDEWMLLNSYRAMNWIKEHSNQRVTHDLILEIHQIVTKNTLEGDDSNFSGKYRDDDVMVGNHKGVHQSRVKPALDEAIDLVVNNKRFLHGLLKGIILHYFIGYIHPFFDGNGRTARALFYFKCIKNDLKFVELLSISAYLKGHGKRYEKAFDLAIKYDLDITYFIDFCLESLIFALEKVDQKINYLLKIDGIKDKYNLNSNQVSLLQRLALNKFVGITSEQHAKNIERSREPARQELKDLCHKGFLREKKQGKKIRYF
ncbi:MAG: Fic family protein, partial [Halobacteriovoraceae bacterium]|nr:Fic family protein [Halobacteriovoraceae bacterium]